MQVISKNNEEMKTFRKEMKERVENAESKIQQNDDKIMDSKIEDLAKKIEDLGKGIEALEEESDKNSAFYNTQTNKNPDKSEIDDLTNKYRIEMEEKSKWIRKK